jgi:site-specific DNA-methyltransferase (adenine-specific)
LIWDKQTRGLGYHFPAQHEFIVMAEKVRLKNRHRKLNTNHYCDILSAKRLKGKDYYPTEKPKELIWALVMESSNDGDVCLDPFCGSGVLGEVCEVANRRYILGDINPTEAVKRLVK